MSAALLDTLALLNVMHDDVQRLLAETRPRDPRSRTRLGETGCALPLDPPIPRNSPMTAYVPKRRGCGEDLFRVSLTLQHGFVLIGAFSFAAACLGGAVLLACALLGISPL